MGAHESPYVEYDKTLMNSAAVIGNFANSQSTYDSHATIQALAAQALSELLREIAPNIPGGDVLEVGCGTGFLSLGIASTCRDRNIVFTDASRQMVNACRQRLEDQSNEPDRFDQALPGSSSNKSEGTEYCFEVCDVEEISSEGRFALIASSFMLQWVNDLDACIEKLASMLVPDGYLLFAVPTDQSFPEWKKICKSNGLEFSGNSLPAEGSFFNAARRFRLKSRILTSAHTLQYADARAFFRSLKLTGSHTRIGAPKAGRTEASQESCKAGRANASREAFGGERSNGTSIEASPEYTSALWQTIRYWNESSVKPIDVTYHIAYGYLRKPHV